MAMKLGEMVLQAVRAAGAREMFGIPGDFVLPFFQVIESTDLLPCYTLSHEPGVGFAADGAARLRGGPAVAVVTYGAGALNMINPIAAAYAEKSPVIVLSGGPGVEESHVDLLLHHQAKRLDSQFQMYAEVTCDRARLSDPRTAPSEVSRVLSACLTESRPVYIELPRDRVFHPCEPAPPAERHVEFDQEALDACVEEIMERLAEASSPVLLVGVEVRRFGLEEKVDQLAKRLGVPVVTSFMGRGLLAGSKGALVGTYIGAAGDPVVTNLVESSDALLLLGVILSDTNLGTSKRRIDLRSCIQALDGQVSLGHHVYPQIPIDALVDRLLSVASAVGTGVRCEALDQGNHFEPDDAAMTPDDIASGLNRLFRESGPMPLVADIGDCLFTAMDVSHTELAAPGYYATMGFAAPAALGVQVASGRRPVVLLGDGAFEMTGWELGNCIRYGWDPIVIVFNNSSWEMLETFQPHSRFHDLGHWDFGRLADALSGNGYVVRTRREFDAALRTAAAERGRFQLIDVRLERGVISKTMRRFADALKRFRKAAASPQAAPTP